MAQGTGGGSALGAGRGAREALAAAAANTLGRGNPRGLWRHLASRALCFGEPDPGASPRGSGRARVARWCMFKSRATSSRTPAWGQRGFCLQPVGPSRCPLCLRRPASQPRAAQIFFWGTCTRAPGAAQRPGRENRTGQRRGPDSRTLGTTLREWPGADPRRKDQNARGILQGPPALLSQRVLQAATVRSTLTCLTSSSFSNKSWP